MINIPLQYLPVDLLVEEDLHPQISVTLARCRDALAQHQWAFAERYAVTAKEAAQRVSSRPVDYALALLHLADVYRVSLRLGLALDYNREAQLTMDKQPGPKYYHNRAVATYALGLTHHALGSDAKASEWYGRARALFERAMRYWAWESEPGRQVQCEEVIRWIDALIQALEQWADVLLEEPFCASMWIPVFRVDAVRKTTELQWSCLPATLRGAEGEIRLGDRMYRVLQLQPRDPRREGLAVRIGGELYAFAPPGPKIPDLPIDFRAPHFALEIGFDGSPFEIVTVHPPPGEQEKQGGEEDDGGPPEEVVPEIGDAVLIRWQCTRGWGFLQGAEVANEVFQAGRFVHDPTGRIKLVVEKRRLIGEGRLIGEVVALLRPTRRGIREG